MNSFLEKSRLNYKGISWLRSAEKFCSAIAFSFGITWQIDILLYLLEKLRAGDYFLTSHTFSSIR